MTAHLLVCGSSPRSFDRLELGHCANLSIRQSPQCRPRTGQTTFTLSRRSVPISSVLAGICLRVLLSRIHRTARLPRFVHLVPSLAVLAMICLSVLLYDALAWPVFPCIARTPLRLFPSLPSVSHSFCRFACSSARTVASLLPSSGCR
jgi:hypothetical protein